MIRELKKSQFKSVLHPLVENRCDFEIKAVDDMSFYLNTDAR